MRNRQLHAALAAFAEEAAWQLASDMADVHELPFVIVEAGGRRRDTPLYCYRPLTAAFIDERRGILSRLESHLPAVHALAAVGGLDASLDNRGSRGAGVAGSHARARAELALGAFLARVFEDSTDFVLETARLERAYAELEGIVHEGGAETVVVAPLLGLEIESAEVAMGQGLTLMRGDVLDGAPDEAVWPRDGGDAHVLAVLRWESAPGDPAPVDHARVRLRRLLCALRLFDEAGVALGPAAWTRTSGGAWQPVVLDGGGGRPHGSCTVTPGQEDELRAFCNLVSRRTPKGGEVAWALHRFNLGCGRGVAADALTDHLLALRALLEPEGPASGRMPGRVAALCAEPSERATVTERVAGIITLERRLVTGVGVPEAPIVSALAAELGDYLRAILRDVLCGHLDPDVRGVADALIERGLGEAAAPESIA
jgi:hypothetical protein